MNRDEFYFFFGADRARLGDSAVLSQWYPAPFHHDGIMYPTCEHWMMAKKAQLFKDGQTLRQILATKQPGQAKRLGRMVKGFDEGVWDDYKYEIVVGGNFLKFSQHSELEKILLSTDGKRLAEASPYDRIWGIGLTEEDPDATTPEFWTGQNLLGEALEDVREMLKQ